MAGEKAVVWSGINGSCGPAREWRLLSSAVIPMSGNDGVPPVGVLTVASGTVAAFGHHERLALEMLAGIAGGFLAKAKLLTVLERTGARCDARSSSTFRAPP